MNYIKLGMGTARMMLRDTQETLRPNQDIEVEMLDREEKSKRKRSKKEKKAKKEKKKRKSRKKSKRVKSDVSGLQKNKATVIGILFF